MHSNWLKLVGIVFGFALSAALFAHPLGEGRLQAAEKETAAPRKVVILAGVKSHGPEGNGMHEYPRSARLLKTMLESVEELRGKIVTEIHYDGWPKDAAALDDAATIMTISDGQDGDLYSPVPWMTPERMKVMEKQMARGCGFITLHFSTFAPDNYGQKVLEWGGGYFDWQSDDGKRNWYSAIRTLESEVKVGSPEHPVTRGLDAAFKFRDEFYYKIRFREGDDRLKPILLVPELGGGAAEQTVAWAVERKDGGRGFCTTCGHFYDNWENDQFRKLILNALVWTAGAEVPKAGVEAKFISDEEVKSHLLAADKMKAVIVTGNHHPAHTWRETTLALEDALRKDPRIEVASIPDPEFLASEKLHDYDTLVLNYCNWEQPGISDAAKANFVKFLNDGGGLVIVHFANGAFHYSLPKARDSDWPEYRKICRRVWNHEASKESGKPSGHDAFGKFQVDVADKTHVITRGLNPFETTDELYFQQDGSAPIHVLATARSKVTGKDEPMAFVYEYGKGRVFQTVLGHAADSIRTPGTAAMIRRAAAWAAGREPLEDKADNAAAGPKQHLKGPLASGAERPRLAVLTDIGGDPDDQQSMIRLMVYANEFDIEALIASASGTPGELKEAITQPKLIGQIIDGYDRVLPNLKKHATGWPEADELRRRVKSGNPHRGRDHIGQKHDTEGSREIIRLVDAGSPERPLNVTIWGGQTDFAQALWRVKHERGDDGLAKFARGLRVYDISDQDGIAVWMRGEFPGLFYILSKAPREADKRQGAYRGMYLTGDESLTSREWVDEHIRSTGPLGALYPTSTWTEPNEHGCLKEGDTPSWFFFLPLGGNSPADPTRPGWGGQFRRDTDGWYRDLTAKDDFDPRTCVSRWRPEFQADFAKRMKWCMD